MPPCPPDKVLNPKTNRCVKKDGAIGKKLLKNTKNLKALLDYLWNVLVLFPDTSILMTMENKDEFVIRKDKVILFDENGKKKNRTMIKEMKWEDHLAYEDIEVVAIANDKLNKDRPYVVLFSKSDP